MRHRPSSLARKLFLRHLLRAKSSHLPQLLGVTLVCAACGDGGAPDTWLGVAGAGGSASSGSNVSGASGASAASGTNASAASGSANAAPSASGAPGGGTTSSDVGPTAGGATSAGGGSGGSSASGGYPGGAAGSGGASNGGGSASVAGASGSAGSGGASPSKLEHLFVLALENHDAGSVIGNTKDAPYLNGLLKKGSSASSFMDELPKSIDSEPHYVWMESGTNAFYDHKFESDDDASASNSTANTEHLATQLSAANISWTSYQESLSDKTGACPISSNGFFAAKHDPFVFFRDVSGNPPSKSNAFCAAHHKPLSALFCDLGDLPAAYSFITPNLCHDMHGADGCPDSNLIHAGDTWLSNNLPPLLQFLDQHHSVLFITWDEGEDTLTLPFLALGPTIKSGFVSTKTYTHSSLLKTVERILGVPVLARVKDANDFSEMFTAPPY